MTTPSKLSLKKKSKQKLGLPAAQDDQEEEKENYPRSSFITDSTKSSRRCSTIIAGNLFMTRVDQSYVSPNVTSRKKKVRNPPALGELQEDNVEEERLESAGGLLTEDESSFYSCPSTPDNVQGGAGAKAGHHHDQGHDTWMTELSGRDDKIGVHTPGNRPGHGSAIKAANFFSVGRRRTIDPVHNKGASAILSQGSDSDNDESTDQPKDCRGKLEFHKTMVADSDEDADKEGNDLVDNDKEDIDDLLTDDEDDNISLVQVGKEYLSSSKFEKINSWVQQSPFRDRLSDYSSRIQDSPPKNADNSHDDPESMLKSDPEDGDIVPSWAAPLPANKTSTTLQDEGSSKAMLSRRDHDDESETSSTETFTDNTENQTSKGMISKPSDVNETDPVEENRNCKEIFSKSSPAHDNFDERTDVDGDDINSREMRNTASRIFSSLNNSKKIPLTSTQDSSVSTKQPSKAKTLYKPKTFVENLDDTIEKFDDLTIKKKGTCIKPKDNEPIVISDDDDVEISKIVQPTERVTKGKAPVIENSVNAVRCWTEEQTKEQELFKQQRAKPVESSSDDEGFENFLTRIRSTSKKPSRVVSSDSDKDFVVPDGEFASDEFDNDSDTPRSPVLSLRERLLRKNKSEQPRRSRSSSSENSLPEIDDTPVSRKPGGPRREAGLYRKDVKENSSDESGSPRNIYQPKYYNQIPTPKATPPPKPKRDTKTSVKKPRAKNEAPRSLQKPPVPSFKTPTTLTFLSSLTTDTPIERCHPQAVPYQKNFKKTREELAKRLYQMYNAEIFEGALPDDMEITWNIRLTKTAGLCYSKRHRKYNIETRSSRIELSTKVIDRGDRLRDTLIHEMCHAASWIISGYRDGHGPLWRTWAEKAMHRFPELPVIDRCHSYQIETKYTYQCVKCGYQIGRHSKSLDTERKVCGHCHGRFELVVNSKASASKGSATPGSAKPKAPTAFAKFVQDNYKVYKAPGTSHADVMKILSTKFSEAKISK